MDKLKAVRGGHRSAITRLINKREEKLETTTINNQELNAVLQTLERKLIVIQTLDSEILEKLDPNDVETEIMDTDEYNLNVEVTIGRFKEVGNTNTVSVQQTVSSDKTSIPLDIPIISATNQNNYQNDQSISFQQTSNFPSTSTANQNSNHFDRQPTENVIINTNSNSAVNFYHKLPKLDLPTFSGDILQWLTFWESFETTVHLNPSLTNIQKFSYLKAQIHNEAARCISGLSLTAANYDQAITLLKDRFGQEQTIINAYMHKLLELPNPTLTPQSLRLFHDSMESSIRGLESLGQSQDSFGSLLVPIIFGKLPIEMRRNMTREHGKKNWDIRSLREAISMEMYVQETGIMNTNYDISDDLTPTASFHTGSMTKSNRNQHRNNGKNQTKPTKSCVFCKQHHSPTECTNVVDHEQRHTIIKQKKLCFNCFGNHKISECTSKYTCRKCNKKHHTSLCDRKYGAGYYPSRQSNAVVNTVNGQENMQSATMYTSNPTHQRSDVLLKTAVAPVLAGNQSVITNILLDEGSQKSFITQELADKLQLKPSGIVNLSLAAFGDASRNIRNLNKAVVDLQTNYGGKISMEVLIVPTIAAPLSSHIHFEASKLPYLQGLRLAHPVGEDEKFNISMLIGADFYWDIVENRVIRGPGPTAVKSKLGYLLSGPLMNTTGQTVSAAMLNVLIQHKKEEVDLERFWKLESMGVTEDETTKKEQNYYETFESSITLKDDHYVAKLPWKDDFPELPDNYHITKRRTQHLIDRLNKEPKMMQVYGQIIADQVNHGFIEKVDENITTGKNVHYIPHHCVKKESTTTPIRIVYDCSCRESTDKPSLNDCLKSVPPEINDLTGLLMRFRQNKYAVTTDIEKAFLQIELHDDDRDVTRFFWFDDPNDPTSPLTTYRFKAVLFGTTCSPFILHATIMKHLKLNPSRYTDILKRGLYVDNILTSFTNEDELLSFYKEARHLFKDGGFNLRSWSSNNDKLCETAIAEDCLDKDSTVKILGMRWSNKTDMISFQDNLQINEEKCLTKRDILQQSSRIFDPLGLLSPVTVRAKLLMQTLWERKFEWDQPLPDDIISNWMDIVKDLKQVIALQTPRYHFADIDQNSDSTLHIFTDASMKAYGACAYLVKGNQSCLVMSKNRVAPLKHITLPKLELMGALLGARLAQHVLESLGNMEVNFWSDSQIVLKWISSSKPLKKFIENRVREIRSIVNTQQWRYCPTDMNPADLLTRGTTAKTFKENTFWKHGPNWITNKQNWPKWNGNLIAMSISTGELDEDVKIENESTFSVTTHSTEVGIHQIVDLMRHNDLKKILRITAYVLRFVRNCRKEKKHRKTSILTTEEIQNSMLVWIKNTQDTIFPDVLKSDKRTSIAKQLKLYKDENGILRCRGRIDHALINDTAKYPYLLPTNHRLTTLIVIDAHESQLHSGVNSTIVLLRQTYWIPRIRQCVNSILRKCVRCRKVIGKPYQTPDPPPLPKDRVRGDIPFSTSGVDFAGPLIIRNSQNTKIKIYLCLFTCATTRAVHIELVSDLTVYTFILALRRFASRHSMPRTLISDNALTFVAAEKEVRNLTNSPLLHRNLGLYAVTWKFIPKRAPWFGGFYERMIGLTKTCLKKSLGRDCVNLETLQTVIAEIEATLNDRPLTYVSSDSTDPEPLTPSHLLYGRRITCLPYPSTNSDIVEHFSPLNHQILNNRLNMQQTIIGDFQKRWKHDYLTSLREYHRTTGQNKQTIQVGDIVQIHSETPRSTWKLAVVEHLFYGEDKMVRAVQLRTNNGTTNRPIAKLYPIEVKECDEPISKDTKFRQSKENAKTKIRKWTL